MDIRAYSDLVIFSFHTDKFTHYLPLAMKEWKLICCLNTGNQLLATSITFYFFPVYMCLVVNDFFSIHSVLHWLCKLCSPRTVIYVNFLYILLLKISMSPLFFFLTHIFFYSAQNIGESFKFLFIILACVSFKDCVCLAVGMVRSPMETSGTWFYSLQR